VIESDSVLVINCGSSSIKFSVIDHETSSPLIRGSVERIGQENNLYKEHGIRRYGFHGTSHRFVTERAAILLRKPPGECAFVSVHLGNGCSACAVLGGKSIEKTVGAASNKRFNRPQSLTGPRQLIPTSIRHFQMACAKGQENAANSAGVVWAVSWAGGCGDSSGPVAA
jgi:butyrate kinase